MDVIVGTYEELILGYRVNINEDNCSFSQHFSDHQHIGCVKTAAISPKGILATGSTDEVIKLFNLVKDKELGSLMQHTGSVTELRFKDSYMFSSSDDGSIIVWKVSKWDPVRTLRGHKGPVHGVDVHPSGKMALTIGKDCTLRTWNLITGKCAFTSNIKSCPDRVLWAPGGDTYALLYKMAVDVYDVETASIVMSIKSRTNLCTLAYLEDNVLAVAGDEGTVTFHDLTTKERLLVLETKTNRVKAMQFVAIDSDDAKFLVTASSDGSLQLYRVALNKNKAVTSSFMCKTNCNFRPTCLAVGQHAGYSQDPAAANQTEANEDVESREEEIKSKNGGRKRKGKNQLEETSEKRNKTKKNLTEVKVASSKDKVKMGKKFKNNKKK